MTVSSQTEGTAATAGATTWAIDPAHTLAEFGVRHMMVSTVKGRFKEVQGTITIDEDDLSKSKVEVEIAAASIDTRDEKRDAHLRSADFLESEQYPAITFTSTKVDPKGANDLRVTGDLTIRGVTKPVVLQATFNGRGKTPWGTDVIGYSATTSFNRKDFGLVWNVGLETGGMLVGDEVKIALELEANPSATV